jgi:hypothetical protein
LAPIRNFPPEILHPSGVSVEVMTTTHQFMLLYLAYYFVESGCLLR